jgi:menaquinone-dependent protoporphyrinogen oxidase
MASRILVIYGTSYGQTLKIAIRIAGTLERRGCRVELCDAARQRPALPLEQYNGVVVGSSIIARGPQKPITQFVLDNLAALNRMPSAYFQVSASAGSVSEQGRRAAQRILEEFLGGHGWTPVLSASMAGAVNYTSYPFLLRWYMKRAAKKNGGPTDTSRDHELTDWAQVDRFALAIANTINPVMEFAPAVAVSG